MIGAFGTKNMDMTGAYRIGASRAQAGAARYDDGATKLSYDVQATVSGRLDGLGSDSTVKKLATQFFENFHAHLNPADQHDAEHARGVFEGEPV